MNAFVACESNRRRFLVPSLPPQQLAQLDDKGWKTLDGLIGVNAS